MKPHLHHPWRFAAIGLVLLTLAIGGWYAFYRSAPATQQELPTPALAVRAEAPIVQTIEETARYLATIKGRDDAMLSFRVSGTLGAVYVREGDRVRAGQRLASLAAPEVEARLERVRSELARAETNLDHWQREHEIDERLYEKGAISRSKLDQTRLSLANAERQRDAAVASLREAQHTAEAHTLVAPRDGIISRVDHEPGETVMPGQPVFQLNAGARRLQIDVLASERERGLRAGSPVRIETAECETAEHLIEQIETTTRPPFESVRAYASLPGDCLAGYPSGSTLPVHLVLERAEEAVLVPVTAIDLRDSTPRIFRIGPDETAEAVPVELGLQAGERQQIIGSIHPGDRIVVSGTTNLEPGMQVRVSGSNLAHR